MQGLGYDFGRLEHLFILEAPAHDLDAAWCAVDRDGIILTNYSG